NDECASGFCVDSVCCDTACDGHCQTCALPALPGKCVFAPNGIDPHNDCGPSDKCLGTCDGHGSCTGGDLGNTCRSPRCLSKSTLEGPMTCTADLLSCDESITIDCTPYGCEPRVGACRAFCGSTADCADGFRCELTTRSCVPIPEPHDAAKFG